MSGFPVASTGIISGDIGGPALATVGGVSFANLARSFSGSGGDLITMPTAIYSLMQGLTMLSMSSWFKGSAAQSLVRFQSSSSDYADLAWSGGGAGGVPNAILSWDSSTGGPKYSSSAAPASPQDSLWHLLSLTWLKNGTFFAYVDGVVANSQAAANVAAAFNTINFNPVIGNYQGTGTELMSGACADCAVWGTQLSGTDVANLASKKRANTVQPGSLLWYLPIVGQSPEPDYSGNGNSGTVTGTTLVTGPFS